MKTKNCRSCLIGKNAADFHSSTQNRDGLRSYCKECMRAKQRAHSATESGKKARRSYRQSAKGKLIHKESNKKYLTTDRARLIRKNIKSRYLSSGNGKLKTSAYDKWYAAHFPERKWARNQINNAINQGKIVRKSCEKCGVGNAQAHHFDYSNPFDVIWLCPKHHAEEHA